MSFFDTLKEKMQGKPKTATEEWTEHNRRLNETARYGEEAKLERAKAGYEGAKRSREKAQGSGGSMFGNMKSGSLFGDTGFSSGGMGTGSIFGNSSAPHHHRAKKRKGTTIIIR